LSNFKINDAYTVLLAADHAREAKTAGPDVQSHAGGFGLDNTLSNLIQTLEKMGFGSLTDTPKATASESAIAEAAIGAPAHNAETYETIADSGSAHRNAQKAIDSQLPKKAQLGVSRQSLHPLSGQEEDLKLEAYGQLKELLRQQKFPRAIALVEGLAHRMPTDTEIVQWQAIVYQRWGRRLIKAGQPQKARIYLTKALRTDPNNQALWREINLDFYQLPI